MSESKAPAGTLAHDIDRFVAAGNEFAEIVGRELKKALQPLTDAATAVLERHR